MREDMFMIYNQKEGKKRRKKETYRDQTLSLKFINYMCTYIYSKGSVSWLVAGGSWFNKKISNIFAHHKCRGGNYHVITLTQLPVFYDQ